jgi:acyl-CoA thioester hydrolase
VKINSDFSNCLTVSENLRIPFHDVDPAGVAWHGRYFKYFESVRCILLEEIEYSYEGMMNSGYLWPIVETAVRYVYPLRFNQEACIEACLREWELRLVLDYRIKDEKGIVCTRARTIQVPVDAKTQEMTLGSPEILIRNVERRLNSMPRDGD